MEGGLDLQRQERRPMRNDPVLRLNTDGQAIVRAGAAAFEASIPATALALPSEGERLALRRAMARFLIDTGLASALRYV